MKDGSGKLAVVTGASTGIGYELGELCADHGMDLVIASNDGLIEKAAEKYRSHGVEVTALTVDLATQAGVDQLVAAVGGRPVEHLIANAGQGLGHAFVEQDWQEIQQVIDTNVTGTVYLLRRLVPSMVERGEGKVLITGSIAGLMPGSFQAVYNATKAFIDSFAWALRNELKDSGVTVTCLMPGVTDTEFFERADMMDTHVGTAKKMDPKKVAEIGREAMMRGDGDVVAGLKNKLQAAMTNVLPEAALAEQHRKQAEPGTGDPANDESDRTLRSRV